MEYLEELAQAVKRKNQADDEIANIIGRPAEKGHVGEYIAARIFNITLHESAAYKGSDGYLLDGDLEGKSVNIKWYSKQENILDINPDALPDYYLVMTGPKAGSAPSRGKTRPWVISYIYLMDAIELVEFLKERGVKIGITTSIRGELWEAAEIYPESRNGLFKLSEKQRYLINLFS